jgi:hypothetical protein
MTDQERIEQLEAEVESLKKAIESLEEFKTSIEMSFNNAQAIR